MQPRPSLIRLTMTSLIAISIAICLIPGQAAVIREINNNTKTPHPFKVTKEKFYDEISITVTVPRTMAGEVFQSLRYSIDGRTRITTNGTRLEFVMDPVRFDKAIAYVDYIDPNHDPEETGGYTVYKLDLSSLVAEPK